MKKILAILLALVATTSLWAYDFKQYGIYYNFLDDKHVEVTSGYSEYSGQIKIPSTVTYNGRTFKVVAIGEEAFFKDTGVESVTIPNSVSSIGELAFGTCIRLKSITIPNSVRYIGPGAFGACTGLTSVTIPNSVKSIASNAFWWCTRLTSLTIPCTVETLGNDIIDEDCNDLTITITANSIEEYCKSSINLKLREGKCYKPRKLVIAGKEVKNLVIPSSVKQIKDYAFYKCSGLTSVTIPEGVTSIGRAAFADSESLKSVTIPASVKSIGLAGTFQGCTALESVQWNATNCTIDQNSDGEYYSPFCDLSSITSFTFGSNVQSIPAYLCYGLSGLTSITIPASVTSIEDGVFRNCSSLPSITIPEGVTSIG
ncbi:MAG: leucine-rich repeat domain-containing protein, partial [Paludibacteraceae bacterium]|nr:leucine-rich repeat domain-containing protein [Paludibacteraceae bacterium]